MSQIPCLEACKVSLLDLNWGSFIIVLGSVFISFPDNIIIKTKIHLEDKNKQGHVVQSTVPEKDTTATAARGPLTSRPREMPRIGHIKYRVMTNSSFSKQKPHKHGQSSEHLPQ